MLSWVGFHHSDVFKEAFLRVDPRGKVTEHPEANVRIFCRTIKNPIKWPDVELTPMIYSGPIKQVHSVNFKRGIFLLEGKEMAGPHLDIRQQQIKHYGT